MDGHFSWNRCTDANIKHVSAFNPVITSNLMLFVDVLTEIVWKKERILSELLKNDKL